VIVPPTLLITTLVNPLDPPWRVQVAWITLRLATGVSAAIVATWPVLLRSPRACCVFVVSAM
jgi:hypothetical protein